jgi:tetratricopeptide (TPR) repeat protein
MKIVRRIVTTLNLELNLAQQGIVIPRSTENLEAYDDLLRGIEYFASFTKDGNTKAREMFEKAIELDPKYAWAYAALGENYYAGWANAYDFDANALDRAMHTEQQAVALDDSLSLAHSVLAAVYVQEGEDDKAVTEAQRGIALDPNSASGYGWLAEVLNAQMKPAAALVAVEKAMRLDPHNSDNYAFEQGEAYTQLGQWKEAISALKRLLARQQDYLWSHVLLTDDYNALGDDKAARAEAMVVERAVALHPESAPGYLALASVMNATARPAEALVAVEKAKEMHLRWLRDLAIFQQGWACTQLGRWEEAISTLKRFSARHEDSFQSHLLLAEDYVEVSRDDAARAEAAEVLRLSPQFSLKMIASTNVILTSTPGGKRFETDLRKVGLK